MLVTLLVVFHLVSSEELTIATFNTYDIVYSPNRDIRRNEMMNGAITDGLPNTDILCMQEAFLGINDWLNSSMNIEWPYQSYYTESFHSTLPCPSWIMNEFTDPNGLMYECTKECALTRLWPNAVRGVVSWIICVYKTCFGDILGRNNAFDPIPDQKLYDFGRRIEESECLGCLWQAPYIIPPYSSNPTNISLDALYNLCSTDYPSLNFRSNAGLILWSKLPLTNIRTIVYPGWFYIPRMAIIATIEIDNINIDIGCTHLEPPQQSYLGNFVSFDYGPLNIGVNSWYNLNANQIDILHNSIIHYNNNPNVIVLGDFNSGPDADSGLYNQLLFDNKFRNVYSINEKRPFTRSSLNPLASVNETIDHIIYKGNMRVKSKYTGMNEAVNGQYMSDHFAVRAVFEIGETDSYIDQSSDESDDSDQSSDESYNAYNDNFKHDNGLAVNDELVKKYSAGKVVFSDNTIFNLWVIFAAFIIICCCLLVWVFCKQNEMNVFVDSKV